MDLLALVALKLENVSELRVSIDVAITTEIFLQSLQNPLQIILNRNALHSSDGLATIALLTTDVDLVGALCFDIAGLSKRIESFEVMQGGHKLIGDFTGRLRGVGWGKTARDTLFVLPEVYC